jgi:hypothetical protein
MRERPPDERACTSDQSDCVQPVELVVGRVGRGRVDAGQEGAVDASRDGRVVVVVPELVKLERLQ